MTTQAKRSEWNADAAGIAANDDHLRKPLRLYRFTLPVMTNDGKPYDEARRDWQECAVRLAGGLTCHGERDRGVWRDPVTGQDYREEVEQVEVAADPETRDLLLSQCFRLFPDQRAIMVADLGEASIIERPGA